MRAILTLALPVLMLAPVGGCTRPSAPAPARFALLAGASGEGDADRFFLEDLAGFRSRLVDRGWSVRVVAGAEGTREGTDEGGGRRASFPESRPATNANLLEGVRETLAAAAPGQQGLIVFHSHGIEREAASGQRSHSITSEDRDPPGEDGSPGGARPGFDLDEIEPLLKDARSRGVRVALVDLSCYSGATRALQGPSCTVTLASRRYVSLCSGRPEERRFSSAFFALPAPGTVRDLETHFMEARRKDLASINLPEISSRPDPLEDAWDELFVEADPLDVHEDLRELRADARVFSTRRLTARLDAWLARSGAEGKGEARASIVRELERLASLRARLTRMMPRLARDHDVADLEVPVPGRGVLPMTPAALDDYLAEPVALAGRSHAQRNLVRALQPARAALRSRFDARLEAFRSRSAAFDDLVARLEATAGHLFDAERRLYDLYPRAPASAGAGCSEFAL